VGVTTYVLLELAKALAPRFANHKSVHGWMYHQQQLVVATFDAGTEATVLVDYAATAALSAKYVLTCEFPTTANQLVALVTLVACMGVILVKTGEPQVRLPIWVCQAAPGGNGDRLNYCAPATSHEPPLTGVRCTAVKAALLRPQPQPCAMLPRARPVALAPSNPIFTMRRRSHKANCQKGPPEEEEVHLPP
jgi:hypothetical protein